MLSIFLSPQINLKINKVRLWTPLYNPPNPGTYPPKKSKLTLYHVYNTISLYPKPFLPRISPHKENLKRLLIVSRGGIPHFYFSAIFPCVCCYQLWIIYYCLPLSKLSTYFFNTRYKYGLSLRSSCEASSLSLSASSTSTRMNKTSLFLRIVCRCVSRSLAICEQKTTQYKKLRVSSLDCYCLLNADRREHTQ